MSNTLKSLIVIIVFLGCTRSEEEDNPFKIDNHSWEYYKNARPEEIVKKCEFDEMKAYELRGDASSLGQTNEICPGLKEQCCGNTDFQRIRNFWWRDRKRQMSFHRAVLLSFKWILGYAKEFRTLASKVIEDFDKKMEGTSNGNTEVRGKSDTGKDSVSNVQANKFCYDSAKLVVNYDWGTREKSESFYHDLSQKVEFIENTRRGFYCMLCSVEGQEAIYTNTVLTNWLYNKRIYYKEEFCNTILDHTQAVIYALYKSFNHYLQHLISALTCVSVPREEGTAGGKNQDSGRGGNSGNLMDTTPPQLPVSKQKILENPLNIQGAARMELCDWVSGGSSFKFTACEFLCQEWNIAKAVTDFDGDIEATKKLIDFLKPYRQIFVTPRANLFRLDQTMIDKDIEQNFDKRDKSGYFYKSTSKVVDLANYKSDFISWGFEKAKAINPMEMANDCVLTFEYNSLLIMTTFVTSILALWIN